MATICNFDVQRFRIAYNAEKKNKKKYEMGFCRKKTSEK